MIDAHCHLEQKEYDGKLDELIERWKKGLRFIVSSCAHFEDLNKTIEIYEMYKPFVRVCIGLHPEFIKNLREEQIEAVFKFIRRHVNDIVAIGEVGLDYHWVKEPEWREKQKTLFIRFIRLAKELNLPLVVHSWAGEKEAIAILENEGMRKKKVLMHCLTEKDVVQKVIENDWFVSIGPGILKSKDVKRIVRDMSINKLMLETDSPWFKQEGQEFGEPINVKFVLEKIAEIKKIPIQEVEKQTDRNAIDFFHIR